MFYDGIKIEVLCFCYVISTCGFLKFDSIRCRGRVLGYGM